MVSKSAEGAIEALFEYRVFTTEFDLVCRGSEVDAVLDEHAVFRDPPHGVDETLSDRLSNATDRRRSTFENLAVSEDL